MVCLLEPPQGDRMEETARHQIAPARLKEFIEWAATLLAFDYVEQ